jgi:hypothetical protein
MGAMLAISLRLPFRTCMDLCQRCVASCKKNCRVWQRRSWNYSHMQFLPRTVNRTFNMHDNEKWGTYNKIILLFSWEPYICSILDAKFVTKSKVYRFFCIFILCWEIFRGHFSTLLPTLHLKNEACRLYLACKIFSSFHSSW